MRSCEISHSGRPNLQSRLYGIPYNYVDGHMWSLYISKWDTYMIYRSSQSLVYSSDI